MASSINRRRGSTTRRSTGLTSSSISSPWARRTTSRRSFGSIGGPHGYAAGSTYSWNRTGGSSASSSSSSRSTRSSSMGSGSANYRSVCATFEQKINSFKALCAQATGPASAGRPSPSTLNSFGNWVNKGAVVQRCSSAQIARWSGTSRSISSATTAKTVLCQKFGRSAIKAVTCDKSGGFLVATSPTVKGRTFKFPQW